MKYQITCALLAAASCALLASPVAAQTSDADAAADDAANEIILGEPIPPGTIVVVGEPQMLIDNPAVVTLVTAHDLARWQSVSVADALTRIPGVTATSNGPMGSFTGVRIRGADAAQTLVVINGVRVGDPSSPGGGFDFGNLTSAGVSRIEVLSGSNSLAWGSDAIGGVVVVETAGMYDEIRGSAENGAHDFARATLAGGTHSGDLRLGGSIGYTRSDGISAASAGSEADGFRQFSGTGRASLTLGRVTIDAALVHASGRLDLDGFAPPTFSFGDTGEYQETQENYASLSLDHDLCDGGHSSCGQRFSVSLADINRDTFDPATGAAPSFAARGRSERIAWQGRAAFGDALSLFGGIEREYSRMATASAFSGDRQRTAVSAAWAQLLASPAHGLTLGGGVRLSDHRDFGGNSVFAANVAWRPGDSSDWKLRASFAQGYKAPTLFQLSADPGAFGNPALQPERSRSYDAGVDYALWGNRYTLSATLFRRDSDNLIDFVTCSGTGQPAICTTGTRPFGTYANIARARAEGVEISAMIRLSEPLTLTAGFAHVATRDRSVGRFTSGNRLPRRPVNSGTVSVDYVPDAPWSIGADLRYVGASYDDAGNSVRLDDYLLAGLRGTISLTRRVELFGRVENLFDADYVSVAGYSTYGRSAFVGVRLRQ